MQRKKRHSSDSESGGSEWKGSDKSDDDDDDHVDAKKPKVDEAIDGSKNFKEFLAQKKKTRDQSDSEPEDENDKYIDPDQAAMNLLQKEIEKYKKNPGKKEEALKI